MVRQLQAQGAQQECNNDKFHFFALLVVGLSVHFSAYSQNDEEWTRSEINKVFEMLQISHTDAMSYVEKNGMTVYDFGVRLIEKGEGDIVKAKDWFLKIGQKTGDAQYLYGYVRALWKMGHVKKTLNAAAFLLTKEVSPLIRARLHYLLGHIYLEVRDFESADSELNAGLEAYKAIPGKFGGQFLCIVLLANSAILSGRCDRLESFINESEILRRKAIEHGLKPFGLGTIYDLYAQMHFQEEEFLKALQYNLASYDAFIEDKKYFLADEVKVKTSLLYLLTGDLYNSRLNINEIVDRYKNQYSGDRILAYAHIAMYKIAKCGGQHAEAKQRKKYAFNWALAESTGQAGQELIELFHYVDRLGCPSLQKNTKY